MTEKLTAKQKSSMLSEQYPDFLLAWKSETKRKGDYPPMTWWKSQGFVEAKKPRGGDLPKNKLVAGSDEAKARMQQVRLAKKVGKKLYEEEGYTPAIKASKMRAKGHPHYVHHLEGGGGQKDMMAYKQYLKDKRARGKLDYIDPRKHGEQPILVGPK